MRKRRISPILTGMVRAALTSCEGVRFHTGTSCPSCGGTLSGYDEHKKRFAVLLEDDEPRPVQVIIQRSYCHDCGKLIVPEEPFYPGTRIGSPVVDLCRSLSATMPPARASSFLARMGVSVDRWSARHYSCMELSNVPAMEVFGMMIPASIIALSSFPRPGSEPCNAGMDDVLLACTPPFVPFCSDVSRCGDPGALQIREERQKIIEGYVKGLPRPLGIVFLGFCILLNMVSEAGAALPAGLIDLAGVDMEMICVQVVGCL
jgi:hypothetical protein